MCGLIHIKSKDGTVVADRLWERYQKQKTRGQEGFGMLEVNLAKLHRVTTEAEIEPLIKESLATEIMFHHRLPTSTDNIPEATHPIIVRNEQLKHSYFVIHNGVIGNADELRKEHEAMGFVYTTIIQERTEYTCRGEVTYSEPKEVFNDSESFAIDLALFLEHKSDKIKSTGSIAFVAIETDADGKPIWIHYGHNYTSPLTIEDTETLFCLSSIGGKDIPTHMIFSRAWKGEATMEKVVTLGYSYNYHTRYLPPPKEKEPQGKSRFVKVEEKLEELGREMLSVQNRLAFVEDYGYDSYSYKDKETEYN